MKNTKKRKEKILLTIANHRPLVFETFLKLGKLQCKSYFNKNQVLLLTIDNFETNQIVLYLPGGYMMHLETTCHVSHVTCQVQHVTFYPFPNPKSYRLANFLIIFTIPYPTMCHVSRITCQMSHFTCPLSCITSEVSNVKHFSSFFFQKGVELVCGRSVINGAYPAQFLDFFLLRTS